MGQDDHVRVELERRAVRAGAKAQRSDPAPAEGGKDEAPGIERNPPFGSQANEIRVDVARSYNGRDPAGKACEHLPGAVSSTEDDGMVERRGSRGREGERSFCGENPRAIVPREQQGGVVAARRDDDRACADLHSLAGVVGGRDGERLGRGRIGRGQEHGRGAAEQLAARRRRIPGVPIQNEDGARARTQEGRGRSAPADPSAHDCDLYDPTGRDPSRHPRCLGGWIVVPTESTDNALVERGEHRGAPKPSKGVDPPREHDVDDAEEIERWGGPSVRRRLHGRDVEPFPTGPDVGPTLDPDEAVRAVADPAEGGARAMVADRSLEQTQMSLRRRGSVDENCRGLRRGGRRHTRHRERARNPRPEYFRVRARAWFAEDAGRSSGAWGRHLPDGPTI